MDPCSLPSTATTSIVQAVSARRAAQRASLRNRAAASEAAAGSSERPMQWSTEERSSSTTPTLLEGELQGPPSIPLTEMLPLLQLPRSREPRLHQYQGVGRPPVPGRQLLTNADIIATIEEVLEMIGDDALPPTRSTSRNPTQPLRS